MAKINLTETTSNNPKNKQSDTHRQEMLLVLSELDDNAKREVQRFAEYLDSAEGRSSTAEELKAKGQSMIEEYKASLKLEQQAALH